MTTTRTMVPLEKLVPRAGQVRRTFVNIEELARSIEKYSLLQNLVVRRAEQEGFYEIVAGERRYRALKLLLKEGRLANTDVPCVVLGTDGLLENLVENVQRDDVPLWHLGRTYITLSESGLTQLEIANRLGRKPGHVSTAMILAHNLAPPVVQRLDALAPNAFPIQRLLRLAKLVTEHGDPDEHLQAKLFSQMLEAPGRRGRRPGLVTTQKQTVWNRFQTLRQGKLTRIDPVYQPFLQAVVKYLAGETRGLNV